MGHIYANTLFVVYLKFKLNWVTCIFAKYGDHTQGEFFLKCRWPPVLLSFIQIYQGRATWEPVLFLSCQGDYYQ